VGDELFFPELLIFGLLWLSVMLSWAWLRQRVATDQTNSHPAKQAKRPAKPPKPFAGLTHKPYCAACEDGAQPHTKAPPVVPPPLIISTQGCPRKVDTPHHFCPHPRCHYYGWAGRGNIHANGHPNSGPWRQFHCGACGAYFLETHGTPFHGKRVAPELLAWAAGAVAEGLGIRAVARVFEVDPNTVLQWLIEVAEQAAAFSQYFLNDLHVTQVQLDELFALLSIAKAGEVSAAEVIQPLSHSPHWVWVALDPVSKLLLTIDVGQRTLAMAQQLVHQVTQILAPGCVPLFLTDGFKDYMRALLTHFGHWVQLPRQRLQGPTLKPRWLPLPQLLYAQVVKSYRRRRLVRVCHRVVFGSVERVRQVLATYGWQINTAFIERINLTIRQRVAAVGRRVITLCKSEAGLRQQLVLSHVYYNFCLPHTSLCLPLPQPEPTNGTGSAKRWRPCTPAMAAGLTAHVWTLREVLLFRVPPWPQPESL